MNNGGDFDPSFMVKEARRQQQLYENMQQPQGRQRQNQDEFQYHQQPQNGIYRNSGPFPMSGAGAGMSHPNFNPPPLDPFAMMQRQQQQQQQLFNLQRHHHGGPSPIPGQDLFAAAAAMNRHAMTNGMNPAMNPAMNRMQSAINPLAALSAMNAMNSSSSSANTLNHHFGFQPNNQFQAQDHHNNPFASQRKDDQQLHTNIAQFPLIPPNHSEINAYADFQRPPENPTMTSKAQVPLFRPKSTSPLMDAAATIAAARAAAVAANLIIPPDLPSVHQTSSPKAVASKTSSASATTSALPPLAVNKKSDSNDKWLEGLQIKCSDISVKPISGKEVVSRVRVKTDNVVTRYLPCVEFLVACQQDLRTAPKRSTKQFFTRYLAPLPNRFFSRNRNLMEPSALEMATAELQKLVTNAKKVQKQGCEIMKNTFLGGMKDGESWGLRKWLSKQGGALHICNDLECILRSCQDLDRSLWTTKRLSDRLRPFAKHSLSRLRSDVPSSYQEISTAHPYLPFFHRLEAALRSMGNFDPEDDDVICIDDDDEIAEAQEAKKTKEAHLPKKKRAVNLQIEPKANKRPRVMMNYDEQLGAAMAAPAAAGTMVAYGDSDEDDVIEIIDVKETANKYAEAAIDPSPFAPAPLYENDWECPRCTMLNAGEINRCCMCDQTRDGDDESKISNNWHTKPITIDTTVPFP